MLIVNYRSETESCGLPRFFVAVSNIEVSIMDELVGDIFRPILRLLYGFLRFLHFLAWELLVSYVGWSIGWAFYRTITFGVFPREKWSELEDCGWLKAIFVEFTGLAILAALICMMAELV
ncbi:hypothetical protein GCM10025776_13410 [Corallincola platygyrae]